jgi:hypothetical protein
MASSLYRGLMVGTGHGKERESGTENRKLRKYINELTE